MLFQQGLERDGVRPAPGKAGVLPHQDYFERPAGAAGISDHPLELRPIGGASTLGLVDILPDHFMAVPGSMLPERLQLGGDR